MTDIKIEGKKYTMPFSRGILASSLLRAGAEPPVAYELAKYVNKYLDQEDIQRITELDLANVVEKILEEKGYPTIANNYHLWRQIRKQKIPLIILIGGVTGIGKSTIAREIAYRLGIGNIIGSDTIREVMRKIISAELVPALHTSSFLVYEEIKTPAMIDKVVYSFKQQVDLVSVGLDAIIQRAQKEGYNVVIEGVHAVPGFLKKDEGNIKGIFHFVLYLPQTQEHKERLHSRARDSLRDAKYYINSIDNISRVQEYIIEQAQKYGVPVILNDQEIEKTITQIITQIIDILAEQLDKDKEKPKLQHKKKPEGPS